MSELRCTVEGCEFAKTGVCKNGVANAVDCPSLKPVAKVKSIGPTSFVAQVGDALEPEEAWAQSLAIGAKNVTIMGNNNAGKTTLISELFRRFLLPVPGIDFPKFRDSKTLVGFDKIQHQSLMESGLESPDTERSARGSPGNYLHLELEFKEGVGDVMIHDVSGESWKVLREDMSAWDRSTNILSDTDLVLLALDGAELRKVAKARTATRTLASSLKAALQLRIWKPSTAFAILVTKHDKRTPDNEAVWDEYVAKFKQAVEAEVGEAVEVYSIACRNSDPLEMQNALSPIFDLLSSAKTAVATPLDILATGVA